MLAPKLQGDGEYQVGIGTAGVVSPESLWGIHTLQVGYWPSCKILCRVPSNWSNKRRPSSPTLQDTQQKGIATPELQPIKAAAESSDKAHQAFRCLPSNSRWQVQAEIVVEVDQKCSMLRARERRGNTLGEGKNSRSSGSYTRV